MIFTDNSTLNEAIFYSRYIISINKQSEYNPSSGNNITFHDIKDETVDRWYNSSPPIIPNNLLLSAQDPNNDYFSDEEDNSLSNTESLAVVNKNDDNDDKNIIDVPLKSVPEDLFKSVAVIKPNKQSTDDSTTDKPISLLGNLLENSNPSNKIAGRGSVSGSMQLVIYLPESMSPMNLSVNESATVVDIIMKILKVHKENGLKPSLNYDSASDYELRMHEGDGEPDMDFPAFEKDINVSTLFQTSQSNEFCLCYTDGDNDSDYSDFREFNEKGNNKQPPPVYAVDSSYFGSVDESHRNSELSRSTSSIYPELIVNVVISGKGTFEIKADENATLRSILPKISQKNKLRLYTDEYIFVISQSEQKRLMLSFPICDMDVPIKSIGANEYELQKKVYADTAKLSKTKKGLYTINETTRDSINIDTIVYTETTAKAYQEWNIIKKNAFGRKQPRVIGIDGVTIYNGKRGKFSRNSSGVYRAQRDISTIKNIELVKDEIDHKTFCITWLENRELRNIEYTCENSKDCYDIIAKIKYLMNTKNKK